jgi:ribose-phosphate pyrophosphokinase
LSKNGDLELAVYDLSPLPEGINADKNPNTKFSRNVCEILGMNPSAVKIDEFKDGERDPVIPDSVRKKKIFVFQSYIKPYGERKYELELFLDAVGMGGGNKEGVIVVWPYAFGSRGERRTRSRKAAPTLVWAKALGSYKVDTLLTGGIHSENVGTTYNMAGVYFEHLEFEIVASNYILRNYHQNGSVAVLSPDKGGIKRIRRIEKILTSEEVKTLEEVNIDNVMIGSADKIREKDDEIEGSNLLDSVSGYDVLIVDDIGDTLGSLYDAAKNCRTNGAKSVRALLYHATLGEGYEKNMKRIFDEKLVDEIVFGNTVPIKDFARDHPNVKILPFEPLFAEAIKRIHENRSMSELFTYGGIMDVYDRARHLYKGDQKYVKIESIKHPTLDS